MELIKYKYINIIYTSLAYFIIVFLTDCAKMILQSTKSKKGNDIRRYFIEIEKMLYKYKDIIINNLNKELKLVKNNQKPKIINKNKKKIYIFKALNTHLTLYKIGKTIDIKKRLNSHNSALANDIEIIYEYETENINLVEKCIKIQMKHAQYRKYKEIFQIDINIIQNFIKQCDNNINLVKNNINKQNGGNLFMYIPIYD